MQTLTFPASVSKRKQACRSCRQRKKRCSGEKPSCSLCNKWAIRCEYNVPATDHGADAFIIPFQYPGTSQYVLPPLPLEFEPNMVLHPGLEFDLSGAGANTISSELLAYPTPSSNPTSVPNENLFEFGEDIISPTILPSHETLLELVNLFFKHLYNKFPCFHRVTFLNEVRNEHIQVQAPMVLYAICALAARHHHDPAIRSQRDSWYEEAKFLYELTKKNPEPALRTIQTVLCLVFYAWTVGDFSAGWLYLGKAWRQVVALSLNRMDGHIQTFHIGKPQWPTTALEKEEYRRTLWLLFIMDKNYSWPTGWPHAIEEKQFKIDIPIPETQFQDMTSDTSKNAVNNTCFTRSLDTLISSSSSASDPVNLFHYLAVAHVILGRLAEHIHSVHYSPDSSEYAQTAKELDAQLVKFRLSLPLSATSLMEASDDSRGLVVWLNITINTMAILLQHRCEDEDETQEQFAHAVIAAKNTVQIVKDASRISMDLLLSAHIGSFLYVAACILHIHWRLSGDESLKSDIDLCSMLFDRLSEVYYFLGLKYKLAWEYNLKNASEERMLILKENGFRGLPTDGSEFSFVQDEMEKMGLAPKLT